jgi:hypothetical protein
VGTLLWRRLQKRFGGKDSQVVKVRRGDHTPKRGCEGTAQHQMQLKIAVQGMDIPAMTFEGNMADEREFDEGRVSGSSSSSLLEHSASTR